MRWINLGRRGGKTSMMITTSFVTGTPIIVPDQCRKDIVMKQAKDMGLEIGVYTLSEFSRYKRNLAHTQKVLIDEAQQIMEQALEEKIGCEVTAITTSIPMIQHGSSPEKGEV